MEYPGWQGVKIDVWNTNKVLKWTFQNTMVFPGLQGIKMDVFKNMMECPGLQGIKIDVSKYDEISGSARC